MLGNQATCDVPTCCEAPATCEEFTACGDLTPKGGYYLCSGGPDTCDADTCCGDFEATCNTYDCGEDTNIREGATCSGACDADQCCRPVLRDLLRGVLTRTEAAARDTIVCIVRIVGVVFSKMSSAHKGKLKASLKMKFAKANNVKREQCRIGLKAGTLRTMIIVVPP